MSDPFAADEFRRDIQSTLEEFVEEKVSSLAVLGKELTPLLDQARIAVSGGKRFRAAFCWWGFQALWPDPPAHVRAQLIRACAGLEVLHASALVHDDLMDASDSRRGLPAAHMSFALLHRDAGWRSSAQQYGAAGAILLGDLLQGWAEELVRGCGLPGVLDGLELFDLCRNEVIAGQFLDVTVQARGHADVDAAMKVLRFKSAKYSIERPLQIGAALSGRSTPASLAALSSFGLPLGEAFQLRDDLLGVFGDPALTGKPAGDDLREGKRTVLIALTLDSAPQADGVQLQRELGTKLIEDQVLGLRKIIESSGAKQQVEDVIEALLTRSLTALDQAAIDDSARGALRSLASAATHRQV